MLVTWPMKKTEAHETFQSHRHWLLFTFTRRQIQVLFVSRSCQLASSPCTVWAYCFLVASPLRSLMTLSQLHSPCTRTLPLCRMGDGKLPLLWNDFRCLGNVERSMVLSVIVSWSALTQLSWGVLMHFWNEKAVFFFFFCQSSKLPQVVRGL